jgi:phospholipid/cholesterol/gamma-HCH transport system substrate-binding protein
MDSNTRTFELKVGTFILVGIAITIMIIFSIGDINLSKTGYNITVKFNFASGIGPSAPVRLAGVGVGQVQGIKVIYSEEDKRSHAELRVWVQSDAKIEEDAKVTINTLGLLGEKYLEIFPGTPGKPTLKNGAVIIGDDPVVMEKLTENLVSLSDSVTVIVDRLKKGEGTIGKLLTEDARYMDLKSTAANFKEFSEDIKKHPWKLLMKGKESSKNEHEK